MVKQRDLKPMHSRSQHASSVGIQGTLGQPTAPPQRTRPFPPYLSASTHSQAQPAGPRGHPGRGARAAWEDQAPGDKRSGGAPRMQSATSWGQGGGGNTASGRQLVCREGRHELSGVLNPGRPPISKRWGSAGGDCSRTVLAGTWGCPQWGWEKAACSPRGWNQGPQGGTPACSTPLGFLCSTGRLLPLPAGVCPTFQGLCQAAAKPLPLITGSQT